MHSGGLREPFSRASNRDADTHAGFVSVAEVALDLLVGAERAARTMAKGPLGIATSVDIAIEDAVRDFLEKQSPEIGFLGEECGERAGNDLCWREA